MPRIEPATTSSYMASVVFLHNATNVWKGWMSLHLPWMEWVRWWWTTMSLVKNWSCQSFVPY